MIADNLPCWNDIRAKIPSDSNALFVCGISYIAIFLWHSIRLNHISCHSTVHVWVYLYSKETDHFNLPTKEKRTIKIRVEKRSQSSELYHQLLYFKANIEPRNYVSGKWRGVFCHTHNMHTHPHHICTTVWILCCETNQWTFVNVNLFVAYWDRCVCVCVCELNSR